MKKIALDTNAYSALMQGGSDVLSILQHSEWVGLSTIVLGELIGGFSFGSKYQENLQKLNEFLDISHVHVLSLNEETATFYAHLYAVLRKKGTPIPTNDLWIAAVTLQHGCKLCSFDAHFKSIEGLLVTTTLEEFLF